MGRKTQLSANTPEECCRGRKRMWKNINGIFLLIFIYVKETLSSVILGELCLGSVRLEIDEKVMRRVIATRHTIKARRLPHSQTHRITINSSTNGREKTWLPSQTVPLVIWWSLLVSCRVGSAGNQQHQRIEWDKTARGCQHLCMSQATPWPKTAWRGTGVV